ncbi:hypothetical protein ACFSGX_14075 [Sphingomonas arantia]|uniref:Uncharacterized protein n=1 Tax=Sphingomonas arantia TaxID=1460676 RepID=A0ABW4U1Q8_9SPHN
MSVVVTEDDVTLGTIGEQVRRLVGDAVADAMDVHVANGICPALVADGCATGLIAVACAFSTMQHEPGCESQRAYLHAAVDCLFDQLTAFDRGRINQSGETVQ